MIGADASQMAARARAQAKPTAGPAADLLDAVAVPLVLIDAFGRIQRANATFQRILGGEPATTGTLLTDLLGPLVGADERRLDRDQHPLIIG